MAPLADNDLFTLDSTGSQAVRQRLEGKQGKKGGLRASEILQARSSYPAIVPAKHARQREKDAVGLDKHEVRRLKGLVKRKEKASQGLLAVPQKQPMKGSSAAYDFAEDQYDIWSQKPSSSKTAAQQIKAPATLRKHELLDEETAPPSVAAPLPGQSYNPSQQEYQQLLDSATSTLQTQEEKNQQLEQVKSQFDNIRAVRGGKELWELAQDEIMQDNEAEAEVESSATAGNVEESSPKKKQSKQKTSKEKKKRASNINKEKRELAARLLKKTQNVQLANIPTLIKELEQQTALNTRQKQAHLLALRQRLKREGLPTQVRKSGRRADDGGKIETYQLEEDLSESLRGLKPEGNLWKDWQESQVRRRKMPVVSEQKKFKQNPKTKEVERVDSRLWLQRHG